VYPQLIHLRLSWHQASKSPAPTISRTSGYRSVTLKNSQLNKNYSVVVVAAAEAAVASAAALAAAETTVQFTGCQQN